VLGWAGGQTQKRGEDVGRLIGKDASVRQQRKEEKLQFLRRCRRRWRRGANRRWMQQNEEEQGGCMPKQ
jgi:hypothetical protein